MGKYADVEAILIEEVRKYTCLWKTTDVNYKNKTVKENAWTSVADAPRAHTSNLHALFASAADRKKILAPKPMRTEELTDIKNATEHVPF